MKKLLEKQIVFDRTLGVFAFFAKRKIFGKFTLWMTKKTAQLNLHLNNPKKVKTVSELAHTWKELMPPDGQEHFIIDEITNDTAFVEIHLKCPLRGKGNTQACYKLMNYDRQLMDKVGGSLVVLESQSSPGRNHCRLAIRKKNSDLSDLTPAHLKD